MAFTRLPHRATNCRLYCEKMLSASTGKPVWKWTARFATWLIWAVDIGVQQDGLVHVSQQVIILKHPSEVVRIGDIVKVWVLSVDVENRISLTMKSKNPTHS